MSNNPIILAGAAALYIAGGALLAWNVVPLLEPLEDTIGAPIAVLSTLVFSVAVMGYLFFYAPAMLLLGGKHQEGMSLFFKTLGFFAVFIAAIVLSFLLFA